MKVLPYPKALLRLKTLSGKLSQTQKEKYYILFVLYMESRLFKQIVSGSRMAFAKIGRQRKWELLGEGYELSDCR